MVKKAEVVMIKCVKIFWGNKHIEAQQVVINEKLSYHIALLTNIYKKKN